MQRAVNRERQGTAVSSNGNTGGQSGVLEASIRGSLDDAQNGIRQVASLLAAADGTSTDASSTDSRASDQQWAEERRSAEQVTFSVLNASRRDDAMESLAKRLSFELPGSTVRVVRGRDVIKSVYDARLGWLGPGNEVREAMDRIYRRLTRSHVEGVSRYVAFEGNWCLNLSEESSPTKFIVVTRPKLGSGTNLNDADSPGSHSEELRVPPPPRWYVRSGDLWSAAINCRPIWPMPKRLHYLGHRPLFTVALTLIVLMIIAAFPVRYPVQCDVKVSPYRSRVVASPFDARLLETLVEPGDTVQSGDTLLVLDGRPLRIELESIEADIRSTRKDEDVALATGEIAESQRAALQRQKLEHRRELLRDRLTKLNIVSPTGGTVIGGELKSLEGATLSLGQTLLEIAPMGRMVFEIEIPEFEISMVSTDADARVKVAAVGGASVHGQLDRIMPSAELRDDQNVFVAKMDFHDSTGVYRPGMNGEAILNGPMRPLVWRYVRGGWEQVLWWLGY